MNRLQLVLLIVEESLANEGNSKANVQIVCICQEITYENIQDARRRIEPSGSAKLYLLASFLRTYLCADQLVIFYCTDCGCTAMH